MLLLARAVDERKEERSLAAVCAFVPELQHLPRLRRRLPVIVHGAGALAFVRQLVLRAWDAVDRLVEVLASGEWRDDAFSRRAAVT